MHRNKIVTYVLLGIFAVTAVIGTTAFRSVQASASVADQAASPQAAAGAAGYLNDANFGKGPGGGTSDQDLATALGITVEKLQAAYTTATDAALKQAVTAGLITQAQADQVKARGGRIGELGRFTDLTTIDYNALLAQALGISVDDLKAAHAKTFNTRIDEAVAAGKLTQEQADLMKGRYTLLNNAKFQSAIQSAYEAAVKQAVTDGVITQAQADQILKEKAGMGRAGLGNFGGMYGGPGIQGGRGDFDGRGQRNGVKPVNPAVPAATPGASS